MNRINSALTIYEAISAYVAANRAGIIDEKWMAANRRIVTTWANVQILRAYKNA